MKKLLTAIFVMATITANAQGKASEVAKFQTETIAMGKLKQGVPASATFIVTNTSKKPLMIERAAPSCGCTVADFTKTPIAPRKTGYIKATYNAAAAGSFQKTISVQFAGVEGVTELHISGEVEASKPTAAKL